MHSQLAIRIETSAQGKSILPWVAVTKRGRNSVESQFFALVGYAQQELVNLSPEEQAQAKDIFEIAMRMLTAFEYIPTNPAEIDSFFEKKLISLESKLKDQHPNTPTLQMAVGIVNDNNILFATSGDILTLQITSSSVQSLTDQIGTGEFHFDTFHAGTLTAHSYILFVPKAMGALLKSDELRQLPLSHKDDRKLEYLETLWKRRSPMHDSIKAVLLEAKPKMAHSSHATAASISNLLDTESKTEDLLSPPILKPILKSIQKGSIKLYGAMKNFIDTYKTSKLPSRTKVKKKHPRLTTAPAKITPTTDKISEKTEEIQKHTSKGPALTNNLSHYVMRVSEWSKKAFENKKSSVQAKVSQSQDKIVEKINTAAIPKIKSLSPIDRFNNLPEKSKLLFLLVLTFIFVFTQSVLLTLRHGRIKEAEQTMQNEVTTIKTLANEASAALIYEDQEKALVLLQSASQRITNLPDFQRALLSKMKIRSLRNIDGAVNKKDAEELKAYLIPIQEKLQNVITVTSSQILSLSELLPDAKGILKKDGINIIYNSNSIVIQKGDLVEKVDIDLQNIDFALPYYENNKILLVSGNMAYIYSYTDKALGNSVLLQGNPTNGYFYGKRLYMLHPEQNQIYRHSGTEAGLSLGEGWINDGTSVENTQAVAIDGSAYTINQNGDVIELLRGKKTSFSLKGLDPLFADCIDTCKRQIWTDDISPFLYILDPIENRIAVFTKSDGKLKVQYKSEGFTNMKDFSIDEKIKTAIILNKTDLISVQLEGI